jgi:hypothetical protein
MPERSFVFYIFCKKFPEYRLCPVMLIFEIPTGKGFQHLALLLLTDANP